MWLLNHGELFDKSFIFDKKLPYHSNIQYQYCTVKKFYYLSIRISFLAQVSSVIPSFLFLSEFPLS